MDGCQIRNGKGPRRFASRWAADGKADESRLNPSIRDRNYLHLAPLSRTIAATAEGFVGREGLRILDLGCGWKPYAPLFPRNAQGYVGIDTHKRSSADVIGTGGSLPFRSAAFDLILCTQVVEHDPEPAATVREAHRVLREGGTLILSAPGVWIKHGDEDYWRWTDNGLRRLLRPFRSVTIHNCGGQYSALFQILNLYADPLPVGRGFAFLVNNLFGLALDRILPSSNLIVNFVAVGTK